MSSNVHPVNRSVLQVRHLPPSFSEAQCVSFLKAHGASSVAVSRRGQAFAHFDNEARTRRAMELLHQLQIDDKFLLVTFARSNHKIPLLPPSIPSGETLSENERIIEKVHAIAPHLGLNYILNPMVKYKYPPLTDTILANICASLRENSNFYTQVLHLMNKMNLQAPFRRRMDPARVFQHRTVCDASTEITSESDLSDEDSQTQRKRPLSPFNEQTFISAKKVRLPKSRIPVSELLPKQKPKQVSECFDIKNPIRKLQLPSISELTSNETLTSSVETGFGRLKPSSPEKPAEEPEPRFNWQSSFTVVDSMEKISLQDTVDHPAFRNYEEGDSCVRLYVKNLARRVTDEDLFLLFGQFVPEDDAERAIFDIRLMQTGRMRGQAFVTFGSVAPAEKALQQLHRLVLKGKPMAIQFAKLKLD